MREPTGDTVISKHFINGRTYTLMQAKDDYDCYRCVFREDDDTCNNEAHKICSTKYHGYFSSYN